MVWACATKNYLGPIVLVPKTIDGDSYVKVLEKNFLPWYSNLPKKKMGFYAGQFSCA